jgi:hypothetical protein
VLDVGRLRSGALIVDDSAPHCFDVRQAMLRLDERADILFTEGGAIEVPQPIPQLLHVPSALQPQAATLARLVGANAHAVMSCTLSGLLTAVHPELPVTVGEISLEQSSSHLQRLRDLGSRGCPAHCGPDPIAPELVERFVRAHGGHAAR